MVGVLKWEYAEDFVLWAWSEQSVLPLRARLNGFNICFNMRSTQLLNQTSGRLNRSFNIVESVKNVESLLKVCLVESIQHFLCS